MLTEFHSPRKKKHPVTSTSEPRRPVETPPHYKPQRAQRSHLGELHESDVVTFFFVVLFVVLLYFVSTETTHP